MMNFIKFALFFYFSLGFFTARAQWEVECGNYCFFNDIQPNCQGVYYKYQTPDGKTSKSYSSWSSSQNGCLEVNVFQFDTHIIYPNQITCNCGTPATTPPSDRSMSLINSTKDKLELLRAQVQGWTMCSPDPSVNYPDPAKPFTYKMTGNCQQMRKANLARNYLSPSACYTAMLPFTDGYYSCEYLGDQMADSGNGCLVGNNDTCMNIKDAQDPVSGSWYRNPYQRRHPAVGVGQPYFSRDQMLGMLAYWTKSKDKNSIIKWLNFVKNNPKAPWASIYMYSLCPPRPSVRPAGLTDSEWEAQIPDDRCAIIPEAFGQIYSVVKYAGLTDTDLYNIDPDLFNSLSSGFMTLDTTLMGEAATAPALGSAAYQIGDTWDAVNIRILTGGNNTKTRTAANSINNRTGQLNPMFHYLANGKATEYGAYLIRKYCTAAKPLWGFWYENGYSNHPDNQTGYWILGQQFGYGNYQYAGGKAVYGTYIAPDGNDCLMFLNQILGNANLTELQCDNGDQLINGSCLKFAFPKPTLAMVNGVDYKIDTTNGALDYMVFNQDECPYGGTYTYNQWGHSRCKLTSSGLTAGNFHAGVNYWVDPTQDYPGVYYAKIKSSCPYGGVSAGSNCQLKSYARPALFQNVRYWVDPNPAWPGVYYQKVNSQCPYGGVSAGPNCQVQAFGSGFLINNPIYFTRSNPSHPGVYYYPRVIPETRLIINPTSVLSPSNISKGVR